MAPNLNPDGSMSGFPGVEIKTPEAYILAEYALLVYDLECAVGNIKTLHTRYPNDAMDPESKTIAEALFRDGVVLFVGCFGKPSDLKLDSAAVYNDDPKALEWFQYFKDLRDAFAAHNFGPMRGCHVAVAPGAEPNTFTISPYLVRLGFPHRERLPGFVQHMGVAQGHAAQLVKSATAVVAKQVAAMGPERVAKLSPIVMRVPDNSQIRMSREKFRSGSKSSGRGPQGQSG